MNILYYTWDEFNADDGIRAFLEMGFQVTTIHYVWQNLAQDDAFEQALVGELGKQDGDRPHYDFVFSFNFFPVVSTACQQCGIPYISLVFDSPFMPLTSVQVNNPVNHIYTFDRKQAEQMIANGCRTIRYSPLGVSADRIRTQTEPLYELPYEHEICFLGNLYNNEYNFYDQIKYLPPYLKGYFDGVIEAQKHVFGYDLLGEDGVVSKAQIDEMHQYVQFDRTNQYAWDEDSALRNMIRRKVTQLERPEILGRLVRLFPVDLYSDPKQTRFAPEGVRSLGYADYMTEMPRIFNRSKINLNLTLRTIISGIPLRVIDVMAAGGFLITTYQEEVAAQFKDGEELVIAYTPEDLAEKCAYYLTHEEEREAIAAAGRRKVLENYDYATIFANMIKESI